MPKTWKTLRLVVEVPVYGDALTTAQLRWAVERVLERHPPVEEFVTSDHITTGRAHVKSYARVQAYDRRRT